MFPEPLGAWSARAEAFLQQHLPAPDAPPHTHHPAMRYAALGGGKRMRPLLVYASGHAFGAPLDLLDHAAAAVELIHAYSLVHDDLPAMDDDALRRGRATVHVAFDEATAVLAGDALQALAFEWLTQAPLAASVRVEAVRTLAVASGSVGMCGGQALDLAVTGGDQRLDELERMHRLKTGALIRASLRLGGLCAGAEDARLQALDAFGDALGLAFQIRDDLLDVEGSTEALGKTAGKDAAQGKPTYPALLGIEGARTALAAQADRMRSALERLELSGSPLEALSRIAVERSR